MLPSDSQALKALLASIFDRQTYGVTDTDAVKATQADILEQAQVILSDILFQWNLSNGMVVVPPEILATCFAFLPFHCRVTASHVSRAWRTAALSSPAVWAEISHSERSPPPSAGLIQMAVGRTGTVPLHLQYFGTLDPKTGNVLRSVMHRLGSLTIHGHHNTLFLNHPAPLLESLCILSGAPILEGFLGGHAGRLKTLHAQDMMLPPTCPALATVTELRGSVAINGSRCDLFSLFPRLQSLSLQNLWCDEARDCFVTGAPLSLTKLELETLAPGSDIISVFKACDTVSLREVTIRFRVRYLARDIGPLLDGVFRLRVEATFLPDFIAVTAHFRGGRRHTISVLNMIEHHCASSDSPPRSFPPIFAQSAHRLAQLHGLSIPITILATFIADAPPLPALAELRLEIAPGMRLEFGGQITPGFPWRLLHSLSSVRVPHVILDVLRTSHRIECDLDGFGQMRVPDGVETREELTASDARDMLAELAVASLGTVGSTAVSVCGFARDAIQDVDIPECLKAYLTFDVD